MPVSQTYKGPAKKIKIISNYPVKQVTIKAPRGRTIKVKS